MSEPNKPTLESAQVRIYGQIIYALQDATTRTDHPMFIPCIIPQISTSFMEDFPKKNASILISRLSEGNKPLLRGIWIPEEKTFFILFLDSGKFEFYDFSVS